MQCDVSNSSCNELSGWMIQWDAFWRNEFLKAERGNPFSSSVPQNLHQPLFRAIGLMRNRIECPAVLQACYRVWVVASKRWLGKVAWISSDRAFHWPSFFNGVGPAWTFATGKSHWFKASNEKPNQPNQQTSVFHMWLWQSEALYDSSCKPITHRQHFHKSPCSLALWPCSWAKCQKLRSFNVWFRSFHLCFPIILGAVGEARP